MNVQNDKKGSEDSYGKEGCMGKREAHEPRHTSFYNQCNSGFPVCHKSLEMF